ncbi:flavin reductase family protein [Nocardia sp. NPDC050697]|uniref:flavin reductase family protein n=1 Tax=Nocardia sp. NPDC050697 TaxID=3155158 RepID=UPI0033F4AEBF
MTAARPRSEADQKGPIPMRSYCFDTMEPRDAYKLITGVVQPRPIAWVSTVDHAGVRNLAPYSFFTVASRDPVTLFLSIGATARPGHRLKDTLANILDTGELVVNIVSTPVLEAMARSSAEVPGDVDEFAFAGLDAVASARVRPPRVAQAAVAIECVLDEAKQVGTDTAVFARALWLHAGAGLVDGAFHVDTAALRPVGRMAGAAYCLDPAVTPSPPIPLWDSATGEVWQP